jgi:cysteine synthase B
MICQNILETINNTPIVRINNLIKNPEIKIYAKLEGGNPGGSIKDRIGLRMIEEAERNGQLIRGKTIIEATSGNTGVALAMIGCVKKYPVDIVMSSLVSIERRKTIEAFGARVILTDAEKGTDGAIVKVRELVAQNPGKYFWPDQFTNKYNKIAHYDTTAVEIWNQTGGEVNYFVSSLGTSGTLMGVGSALKKINPAIKVVSAEPEKGHYIQGLKNLQEAIVPSIYDESLLDDIIIVETEAAFEMARQIVRKEGIFVGMSSGASMLAIKKISKRLHYGTIVTIFPDRGERYLSTNLFS